jgi:hypothetical protein
MKTYLPKFVLVVGLLSVAAIAANATAGSQNNTGTTAAEPTLSTQGIALVGDTSATKRVTLVATDVRDGSVGDGLDELSVLQAQAYCYNPDRARWTRQPDLDFALDGGAISGVAGDGSPAGVTGSVTVNNLPCSRIYYRTTGVNLAFDAGALVHQLTVIQQN